MGQWERDLRKWWHCQDTLGEAIPGPGVRLSLPEIHNSAPHSRDEGHFQIVSHWLTTRFIKSNQN